MKQHRIGIVMNGVTGRMGKNQHLLRSIAAILKQGGVRLGDDEVIVPAPILVGRSAARLEPLVAAVEAACGVRVPFTTDLDAALGDAPNTIYFDAQLTSLRAAAVGRAIAAGKHIYCEKPTADGTKAAYDLYAAAKRAGVKHGAVQDKLWLPGLRKLKGLIDGGFFGQILSVRG
jgi:predicted dehydrogenase